jgi:hypothetical protein
VGTNSLRNSCLGGASRYTALSEAEILVSEQEVTREEIKVALHDAPSMAKETTDLRRDAGTGRA